MRLRRGRLERLYKVLEDGDGDGPAAFLGFAEVHIPYSL